MATATLKGKLTLSDSMFHAGLRKAESGAKRAGASIGSGLKRTIGGAVGVIGGMIAGAITAGAFAGGIKGAYDMGSTLSDLSANTGAAIGDLMVLRQAMADNGVEAEATGGILNKMQKNLFDAANGSKKAALGFAQIGLRAEDLIKLSPTEQMQAIGKAIHGIKDPAARAGAAMDIFGKSGAQLLSMFGNDGAIDGAAKTLGRQTDLMKQNSADFATISNRLNRAGVKLQGFFVGVASALAPTMLQLTAALDKADFAEAGERFGRALITATEVFVGAFKNPGEMLNLFGNLLGAMIADNMTRLRNQMLQAAIDLAREIKGALVPFGGLGGLLTSVMSAAGKTLRGGMTGAVVVLYDALIAAAAGFNAVIKKGIFEVMEALGEIPILGKKLGLAGFKAPTIGEQYEHDKAALKNTSLDKAMEVLRKGSQADLNAPNEAIAKFTDSLKTGATKLTKELITGDFGRSKYLAKAAKNRDNLAATGRGMIDQIAPPNKIQEYMSDPWRKFRGFRTMGFGSGGLQTGSMNGNGGLSGGAFGAVRRGDKARREAAERERLKEMEPIKESNNLLGGIYETMKTAWT